MPLVETLTIFFSQSDSASADDWVVIPSELKRYEGIFLSSDKDQDGLVSGPEIKDIFLKSGLPQATLAHIWALSDSKQIGKLMLEEFALAMWLVDQCKKGIPPPQGLTPNMVPPSLRENKATAPQVVSN
jgi:epidermal growth factor receptor substrate 15